jgi:hypothetical protein
MEETKEGRRERTFTSTLRGASSSFLEMERAQGLAMAKCVSVKKKEGRKEGRKEERKEGKKEGRKEK